MYNKNISFKHWLKRKQINHTHIDECVTYEEEEYYEYGEEPEVYEIYSPETYIFKDKIKIEFYPYDRYDRSRLYGFDNLGGFVIKFNYKGEWLHSYTAECDRVIAPLHKAKNAVKYCNRLHEIDCKIRDLEFEIVDLKNSIKL